VEEDSDKDSEEDKNLILVIPPELVGPGMHQLVPLRTWWGWIPWL